MNEARFQELVEQSWRRKLSPEEEAELQRHLALHPEAQVLWDEETFLNQQLQELRAPPVSSNFTAQVLHLVDREARAVRPPETVSLLSWLRRFMPQTATAALVLAVAGGSFYSYKLHTRTQYALSLKELTPPLARVSNPEIFYDFEAIQQVSAVTDQDLLEALQ